MDWKRKSVVAGTFYPGDQDSLLEMLEDFCPAYGDEKKNSSQAIVAPHAGYVYSGRIAGVVYKQVEVPQTAIVLCPNHTGYGRRISIWNEGSWVTPLGEVPVDEELAGIILKELGEKGDQQAHLMEHAIEVQIPFLQYTQKDLKIVPIVLAGLKWEDCQKVGSALAKAVQARGQEKVLLVASTDMSHYISADSAKQKDTLALKDIEQMNGKGLYQTVVENEISMCGFIPTVSVIEASLLLGAKKAEVLSYGHSGEVSGDDHSVVAYACAQIS